MIELVIILVAFAIIAAFLLGRIGLVETVVAVLLMLVLLVLLSSGVFVRDGRTF